MKKGVRKWILADFRKQPGGVSHLLFGWGFSLENYHSSRQGFPIPNLLRGWCARGYLLKGATEKQTGFSFLTATHYIAFLQLDLYGWSTESHIFPIGSVSSRANVKVRWPAIRQWNNCLHQNRCSCEFPHFAIEPGRRLSQTRWKRARAFSSEICLIGNTEFVFQKYFNFFDAIWSLFFVLLALEVLSKKISFVKNAT